VDAMGWNMQNNKKIKLFLTIFLVMFVQSYSNAEVVKFSNCQAIKAPIAKIMWELGDKTKPFNEQGAIDKLNEPYEFINRSFDTETKILTYQSKKKGDETFVNKSNFKIKDEKTFTIVDLEETGSDPFFNEETKKVDFKTTRVIYRYIIYDLSDGTVKKYNYRGAEKELIALDKCKTNYSSSGSNSSVASSGSGFFINNQGYFVTNNHVVKGCKQSKITFKEEEVDAELIATDETLDLALLRAKIRPKDYLNISDEPPEKMQKVFVAGYPFGKGLSDDLKFTQGIISAVKGYSDNSNQIQLDAAINSGNSGGPIVNEDGDLVAVAVSGLDKSLSEGIGFGIKASSVINFLEVNNTKYSSSSLINFGMNNKKLNKLMEASTVYTFCN
jgi:S1-C subfamily serine protease